MSKALFRSHFVLTLEVHFSRDILIRVEDYRFGNRREWASAGAKTLWSDFGRLCGLLAPRGTAQRDNSKRHANHSPLVAATVRLPFGLINLERTKDLMIRCQAVAHNQIISVGKCRSPGAAHADSRDRPGESTLLGSKDPGATPPRGLASGKIAGAAMVSRRRTGA